MNYYPPTGNMKSLGTKYIYLTGTSRTCWRVVYEDECGRRYVKLYNGWIDVVESGNDYATAEKIHV